MSFNEMIAEFDAGVFEQKLTKIIGETAIASMEHEREGEITIKFKIKPASQSQVQM